MEAIKSLATIRITNLRLQTIIGCNEWERAKKQDVILNISISFDPENAVRSDTLAATFDYRAIKKCIMEEVKKASFKLLEKLTDHIVNIIMQNNQVINTTVRVDKPGALRFADSVSVEMSAERK